VRARAQSAISECPEWMCESVACLTVRVGVCGDVREGGGGEGGWGEGGGGKGEIANNPGLRVNYNYIQGDTRTAYATRSGSGSGRTV